MEDKRVAAAEDLKFIKEILGDNCKSKLPDGKQVELYIDFKPPYPV